MSINITLSCDSCGSEFSAEDEMELPPYWTGVQIAVANSSGLIAGQDLFVHICSQKCFVEFSKGQVIKNKIMLIDKEKPSNKQMHEDEEETEEGE